MYSIGDYSITENYTCLKNFFSKQAYFKNENVILLVLLNGGFSIKKESDANTIPQKKNYTILGLDNANSKKILEYTSTLKKSIKPSNIYYNKNFYKALLVEFCACLYSWEQRQGITTFLHSYRILERIAYALPLLYIRKTHDFKNSFDTFKQFFQNIDQKSGEINFFKKNLKTILKETELKFTFDFQLTRKEKNVLVACLDSPNEIDFQEDGDSINFSLTIIQSINFLTNIRNNFFHALSGKHHISLIDLPTPDTTLFKISQNFINMLSFLASKIIEDTIFNDPF